MIKIENKILKKQPKFWNHALFHPTDAVEDPWGKRILDRMSDDGAIMTIIESIPCSRISFTPMRTVIFAMTSV